MFMLSLMEKNWVGTIRKPQIVRTLSGWPTRGYSSDPTPAAHSAPARTIHPRSARLAGSRLASLQPRRVASLVLGKNTSNGRSCSHAGDSSGCTPLMHLLDPLCHSPPHLGRTTTSRPKPTSRRRRRRRPWCWEQFKSEREPKKLKRTQLCSSISIHRALLDFYAIHAQPYIVRKN